MIQDHNSLSHHAVSGYDNRVMTGFIDGDPDSGEEVDMPAAQPHREMAIDVPKNFVGHKKEPPRYPTPQSNVRLNNAARKPHPSTKPPSPPSARDSSPRSSHATPSSGVRSEDLVNIEKIQKYQEELRARKEQEEAFKREQEFLRNSLRDSQKLKDLQESSASKPLAAASPGFTNPNYKIDEEDLTSGGDSVSKTSTLPVRQRLPSDRSSADFLSKILPFNNS